MQPDARPQPASPPEPTPEEAALLDELARVEHEIAALGEYRAQLRERVGGRVGNIVPGGVRR